MLHEVRVERVHNGLMVLEQSLYDTVRVKYTLCTFTRPRRARAGHVAPGNQAWTDGAPGVTHTIRGVVGHVNQKMDAHDADWDELLDPRCC